MNCHILLLFPFLLLVAGCFGEIVSSERENVEPNVDQVRLAAGKELEKTLSFLAEYVLNFDTGENGAVFWCGYKKETIAQNWAKANGKKTLEQTEGGKYLDGLQLFGEKTLLTKRQAANIWDIASRRYSVNVRGNVYFFSYKEERLNPRSNRLGTLFRLELPILLRNRNVKNIFVLNPEGRRMGKFNKKVEKQNYGISDKGPVKYNDFSGRIYADGAKAYEFQLIKEQTAKQQAIMPEI